MASDPPLGLELHPESFPLNGSGNHTQLIAQLAEEVGYLRGVLDSLDVDSKRLSDILSTATARHDELAAIRRAVSMAKGEQ